MMLHYDRKGKFYTDYVTKDVIPTIIQTVKQRIKGSVYIRPEKRLRDELNDAPQFLAVTHASVFTNEGEHLYKAEFLTINKEHIVWIIPENEFSNEDAEDET